MHITKAQIRRAKVIHTEASVINPVGVSKLDLSGMAAAAMGNMRIAHYFAQRSPRQTKRPGSLWGGGKKLGSRAPR